MDESRSLREEKTFLWAKTNGRGLKQFQGVGYTHTYQTAARLSCVCESVVCVCVCEGKGQRKRKRRTTKVYESDKARRSTRTQTCTWQPEV